jgi:hypothetical protein
MRGPHHILSLVADVLFTFVPCHSVLVIGPFSAQNFVKWS